jgi:hypothetical protein
LELGLAQQAHGRGIQHGGKALLVDYLRRRQDGDPHLLPGLHHHGLRHTPARHMNGRSQFLRSDGPPVQPTLVLDGMALEILGDPLRNHLDLLSRSAIHVRPSFGLGAALPGAIG